MGRIRTIKPEFFKHEGLFDAEVETGLPLRVAFAGLWTVCDKRGRFEWRPRRLKTEVLPYDDLDFSRVLDALTTRGWVVRYECDGAEYGYVPSFSEHQVINNREKESDLPDPAEASVFTEKITRDPRVDDASSTRQRSAQAEREGEGERSSVSDDTDADASEVDLTKVLFDRGVAFLGKSGMKEKPARGVLGRWRQGHGEEAVIAALGQAQRHGAIDPVPFIEGILKSKAAKKIRQPPEIGEVREFESGKKVWQGAQAGWVTEHG